MGKGTLECQPSQRLNTKVAIHPSPHPPRCGGSLFGCGAVDHFELDPAIKGVTGIVRTQSH